MNQRTTPHPRSRPIAAAPPPSGEADTAAKLEAPRIEEAMAMQPARPSGSTYEPAPQARGAGYRVVLSCASGPGDEPPISKGSPT